jgi:uncharacterized protein (DUF302 family)
MQMLPLYDAGRDSFTTSLTLFLKAALMKNSMLSLLLFLSLGASAVVSANEAAKAKSMPTLDIAQTVVKMPLAKGVSMNDAVEAMKIRANSLNIKLVAEMPLSKQIEAMGEKSRRIDIYQFCDPLTAKKMVEYDINFSAYLPCRIALVEDTKGQAWLVMMNLDLFLQDPKLNAALKADAIKVRNTLNEIMQAGSQGAW